MADKWIRTAVVGAATPIIDGTWHWAAMQGDKGAERSGRYRRYLDGIRPAGFIEDFHDPANTGQWKADRKYETTLR